MTNIFRVISSFIFYMSLVSSAAFAKQIVEAEIYGIACSFCAYGLEKKIKKVPGVEMVSVDVSTGKAEIVMGDSAAMEKETLERVVKEAGFTLKNFSVKES